MKKIVLVLVLNLTFTFSFAQEIKGPAEGKSMVYFTRSSPFVLLFNFSYFDGTNYIGKFNNGKYIAYECDPGKHVFWSSSGGKTIEIGANKSYVQADLEAGKTYIIHSEVIVRVLTTDVKLVPFNNDPSSYRNKKQYNARKETVTNSILQGIQYNPTPQEQSDDIAAFATLSKNGMEEYNKDLAEGKKFTQLPKEMFYN